MTRDEWDDWALTHLDVVVIASKLHELERRAVLAENRAEKAEAEVLAHERSSEIGFVWLRCEEIDSMEIRLAALEKVAREALAELDKLT